MTTTETMQRQVEPGLLAKWMILIPGAGLGIIVAHLVANGSWYIALGLLLIVPVFILLLKYPFAGVLIWLVLASLLMAPESVTGRTIYWLIHRALPPGTLALILLGHALKINKRPLPRLGLAELAMAGYLAAGLLSIVTLNEDPQATSYLFYDRVFVPMCLYLIVRLTAPNEKDLQRLMPILFFVCVSQSMIGILSWIAPRVLPKVWLGQLGERTIGSLVNTGVYTTTLMFCGLLLLHAALNRKPGLIRTSYLAAFILAIFCVFLSFSRASWLGLVAAILGLFLLYPNFMIRLCLVAAPIVIVLGSGPLADELRFASQRLYSDQSERSALSRLPVFLAAYRMFEEKPLVGWGYSNFDRYDRQFQGRVANFANDNKDHASHNFYLTLIAEQGLVGATLFLLPFIWWLILTFKRLPQLPAEGFWSRKLVIILWLAILNEFLLNNFSNMRVVYGLGLWWLALGLIASVVYTLGKSNETVAATRKLAPIRISHDGEL